MRKRAPDVWRYELAEGWVVQAGKTDLDNELLTLHSAWPNDYWFHVRGVPGSHVVLSHDDETCDAPRYILEQAAAVAAHHSKARAGGAVAVSCCRIKNIRKPRGARTGTVRIAREKVLKVRPGLPSGGL